LPPSMYLLCQFQKPLQHRCQLRPGGDAGGVDGIITHAPYYVQLVQGLQGFFGIGGNFCLTFSCRRFILYEDKNSGGGFIFARRYTLKNISR